MLLEEEGTSTKSGRDPAVPVVTIDGPSGSGKGTIASQLAKALAWHFLDSGVVYRALAFITQATETPLVEDQLLPLVHQLELYFSVCGADEPRRMLWKQQDITARLRTEAIGF